MEEISLLIKHLLDSTSNVVGDCIVRYENKPPWPKCAFYSANENHGEEGFQILLFGEVKLAVFVHVVTLEKKSVKGGW